MRKLTESEAEGMAGRARGLGDVLPTKPIMAPLTPEQARAVWEAMSEPVDDLVGWMPDKELRECIELMELRLAAITAKPGDEEVCTQKPSYAPLYEHPVCRWWGQPTYYRDKSGRGWRILRCGHPDFDGETCPTGRWDAKTD